MDPYCSSASGNMWNMSVTSVADAVGCGLGLARRSLPFMH